MSYFYNSKRYKSTDRTLSIRFSKECMDNYLISKGYIIVSGKNFITKELNLPLESFINCSEEEINFLKKKDPKSRYSDSLFGYMLKVLSRTEFAFLPKERDLFLISFQSSISETISKITSGLPNTGYFDSRYIIRTMFYPFRCSINSNLIYSFIASRVFMNSIYSDINEKIL